MCYYYIYYNKYICIHISVIFAYDMYNCIIHNIWNLHESFHLKSYLQAFICILGINNAEIIHKLDNGYRMPQSEDVPDTVYRIMKTCWDKTPEKRPTFEYLSDYFENFQVSTQESYDTPQ